jgi:Kef-type K+ transport system membrane component KefB
MFLVGLELEPGLVFEKKRATLTTGYFSVAVPFVAGTALALYLYPRLSDGSVEYLHFALFVGTAMSITAFPVLARILSERRLLRTELGGISLACAAFNDVTGWCVLAGIVLLVRSTERAGGLWLPVIGSAVYVLGMLLLVRPPLRKLATLYGRRGAVSKDNLAIVVVLVLASGWATEQLGIHAIFGAFLLGAMMPKNPDYARELSAKLHDAAVVLLLPLFFAFTGLRTSVGLVRGGEMWIHLAVIVLVAVASKFGGTTLPARYSGLDWRTAASLGALMNTRGLMELVVLNIGLDLGILSPALFTMMVLMAIFTTFLTAPLLGWIHFGKLYPHHVPVQGAVAPSPERGRS